MATANQTTSVSTDSDSVDIGSLFFRAEVVGLSAGVASLIPTLLPRAWLTLFVSESILTLAILLVFGLLAGALASAFANWTPIPPNMARGLSARLGVRAGAFVELVGGGVAIIVASLRAAGIGASPFSQTEPLLVVLVVALSAIPVIFLASLACVLVTTIQVPRDHQILAQSAEDTPPPAPPRRTLLPYVLGFTALALASTAVPSDHF